MATSTCRVEPSVVTPRLTETETLQSCTKITHLVEPLRRRASKAAKLPTRARAAIVAQDRPATYLVEFCSQINRASGVEGQMHQI